MLSSDDGWSITISNGGPYCVGERIRLYCELVSGATYQWTGPDGWSSTNRNPVRPNCTMAMAGTYTCTVTVGGVSRTKQTQVYVYPNSTPGFTSSINYFDVTFTNTTTVDPSDSEVTYLWDFGDGTTSNEINPQHTYDTIGDYDVTLTVSTGGPVKTVTHTVSIVP